MSDPRFIVPVEGMPGFNALGLIVAAWTGYNRADPTTAERALFVGRSERFEQPLVLTRGRIELRERVALDFADTATRDRAARWLGARRSLVASSTAGRWECWVHRGRLWALAVETGKATYRGVTMASFDTSNVPELAALDPHDEAKLPDGSRVVDALALATVCRSLGVTHG